MIYAEHQGVLMPVYPRTSYSVSYPGYDVRNSSYRTPRPVPRVKPEGHAYYKKGWGIVKSWAFGKGLPGYSSPRPKPRCPTSASRDNCHVGRNGNIAPMLNGTATPRPVSAPPRIKAEAQGIATVSRGKRMKVIVHEFGQHGPTPRVARVKPEAQETAEVHKGGRMYNLVHKYAMMPRSARAVPRVKPEAQDIAEVSKGKRMDNIIHKYGKNERTPRPPARVKSEAEASCELGKGKRMKKLIHSYGKMPQSARPVPRVKVEAEASASLAKGGRMSRLMHDPVSYPQTPRPVPRVTTAEADSILRKSYGQMGRILRNHGRRSFVYVPGQQRRSFEQARTM